MQISRKIKIITGILLLIIFIMPLFSSQFQIFLQIPNEVNLEQATAKNIQEDKALYTSNIFATNNSTTSNETEAIFYTKADIPVKKVAIVQKNEQKLVPGGQSVGIQLNSRGVLVVGFHKINKDGKSVSPAEASDIKIGDIILTMNDKEIKTSADFKAIVEEAGKNKQTITVRLKRKNDIINTTIDPLHNEKDDTYQIGLYVRDSTTGIGTLTFYDAETAKYGPLGHVISDAETGTPIEIYNGKIVRSTVTKIVKGDEGVPGEKHAKFSMNKRELGTITKNNPFGVFGVIDPSGLKSDQQKALPIAFADEVKKGPAQILTVIEGDKIEKFDIEIINNVPQSFPATKGMIIKVTDPRLLEKTGGIVQGMSGSPIIQNDKLIGAVTHVFINDPTSGYGVHIEWMLQEAEVEYNQQNVA